MYILGFYYTPTIKEKSLRTSHNTFLQYFAKYHNSLHIPQKIHNHLQAIYLHKEAIKAAAVALQKNHIVLFKGLGGFAFLANARHTQTLQILRHIKSRPKKPFAVMAKYQALQNIALLSKEMHAILHSPQSPIILTLKSPNYNLSKEVCTLATIGVMIPYSAMLWLLFEYMHDDFVLVYTSANQKGDMIASRLDELNLDMILESCLQSSNAVQDFFVLSYEREIKHRLDDSIMLGIDFSHKTSPNTQMSQKDSFYHKIIQDNHMTLENQNDKHKTDSAFCHTVAKNGQYKKDIDFSNILKSSLRTLRVSRAFAPLSLQFVHLEIPTLSAGFGAMQKSSFAFGFQNNVVLSPYMGDLLSLKNIENFRKNFDFFCSLYGIPEIFVTDKHIQYTSTQMAKEIAKEYDIKVFSLGHHHAHFNALLLESQQQSGVGVIFDGSGLGDDGNIWGGEFIFGNFKEITRFLSFKPFRILGGEKHIKDSMRLCLSYAMCNKIPLILEFLERFYTQNEYNLLHTMQEKGLNSPLTSSVGRLFDIAGFLLGLKEITYEGQSGEMIATLALQKSIQMLHATKNQSLQTFQNKDSFSLDNFEKLQEYHNSSYNNCINLDSIAYSVRESAFNPYPFCIQNAQIDMRECFIEMFKDSLNGKQKAYIALRFIDTLAFCVLESLQTIHTDYAVFGGGVFANFMLCARIEKLLSTYKISCFFPKLPCNDYSISLGQLAFVNKKE